MQSARNGKRSEADGAKKRPRTQQHVLSERIHTELEIMYTSGELTDITLCVDGETIQAHRVVLAAASPFFKAMLSSGMEECQNSQVQLPMLSAEAVKAIVSYMYTGKVNITGDNVMELLDASNLLEMVDVINECCSKLIVETNVVNSLDILACAERFSSRPECEKLYRATRTFVNNYFENVIRTDAFLQLEPTRLFDLIQQDALCVTSEQVVFDAAMKWLQVDVDARTVYADEVFRLVRFPFISSKYLEETIEKSGIERISQSTEPHKQQMYKIMKSCLLLAQSKPVPTRRKGIPTIYAVGGCDGKRASKSIEVLDVVKDEWKTLALMHDKRSYFGTATQNGKIYAIGGHNDTKHLSSAEMYDPRLNVWEKVPSMNEVRSYLGVVELNGLIYAIGGYDGDFHTHSVESYNPSTGVWSTVASLNVPRSGLAATVVGGAIYAVGGFDGHQHLNSAERYDPSTDTWTIIPSMLYVRNGPGAVELDGCLHVVGGEYKHGKRISKAECYDPMKNEWTEVPPMVECTSGHGVVAINGMFMYAIGGSNQDNSYLRSANRYDGLSKKWHPIAMLTEMRCGLSVTVVESTKYHDDILVSTAA